MAIYHRDQGTGAPGARRPDTSEDGSATRRVLPLGAQIETTDRGWRLRLRVRAEDVSVSKRTIVAEEVLVRIRPIADVARVRETIRREELRIETDENLHADVTQPLDSALRRDTRLDTTGRYDPIERGQARLND